MQVAEVCWRARWILEDAIEESRSSPSWISTTKQACAKSTISSPIFRDFRSAKRWRWDTTRTSLALLARGAAVALKTANTAPWPWLNQGLDASGLLAGITRISRSPKPQARVLMPTQLRAWHPRMEPGEPPAFPPSAPIKDPCPSHHPRSLKGPIRRPDEDGRRHGRHHSKRR